MRNIWRQLALLVLLILAPSASAQPDDAAGGERILSFVSDIEVRRDASLAVTETIRIAARNDEVRHGIYRDFPTRYRREGRIVRVGLEVAGVTRDGRPEPWRTEAVEGGVRIVVGDANLLLAPGTYIYRIRYRTTRQIGFLADRDELYWNVTGNGWVFAIDRAEVRVRLPARVHFGSRAFYTGATGSTESDARVIAERPGEIGIAATRALGPEEGLTIAVAWPKGIVRQRLR